LCCSESMCVCEVIARHVNRARRGWQAEKSASPFRRREELLDFFNTRQDVL